MKTYKIDQPFKTKHSIAPNGVWLDCSTYLFDRNQKAMVISDIDNTPLLTASVMIKGQHQQEDEIFIKNWSENEGVLEELAKHGIIAPLHRTLPTGYVKADVCKVLIPLELFQP